MPEITPKTIGFSVIEPVIVPIVIKPIELIFIIKFNLSKILKLCL